MRAVVIYESLTGNTEHVAHLIADEARRRGAEVDVFPVDRIGLKPLAEADVVFIGSWTDGLIVAGHRPGRAARLRKMPVIDHKKAAVFCTYAIYAGKTLEKLAALVEGRGGRVVAQAQFKRGALDAGLEEFVGAALATVAAR